MIAERPAAPPPPKTAESSGYKAQKRKGEDLPYIWIPPGTFRMGCSPGDNECYGDEKPAHTVTITKGFWVGQTEVTVGAYKRFKTPPSGTGGDDQPVVNVTWNDAVGYCRWAGGRLPTEAEWEYAARAGTTGARHGELDSVAWYSGNSEKRVHPVAQKAPNAFRLYDMLGNVWEWTADWYGAKYYGASEFRDPSEPPSGEGRVVRGGSWSDFPSFARVSFRYWYQPGVRVSFQGFRCVREVNIP